MAEFNLQFPTQEMVSSYVEKHIFDKQFFIAPRIGIKEDDVSNLHSAGAIIWDVLEPTIGMTKVSSMDAAPKLVPQRVRKTITHKPLYMKEALELNETKLTLTSKLGTRDARAGMELVYNAVDQLQDRLDTFIESACLEMLTGTLRVEGKDRVDYGFTTAQKPDVKTTSGYSGAYWNEENANPIADIRKACEVLRYKGARGITLVMDVASSVYLSIACSDLLKQSQFAVSVGPEKVAELLPGIVGCGITEVILGNQGYADDNGDLHSFIPEGKVFLVGKLPNGQEIGAFRTVPNIYNGIDNAKGGRFVVVNNEYERSGGSIPKVTITAGIYGLPVLYRPDLVVSMTVLGA